MSTSAGRADNASADSPYLSLVIPAYNEAGRIRATLETAVEVLSTLPYRSEVVVSDDGSTDATAENACAFAETHAEVRVISIPHGGKAAATRAGMSAARGELIAFSDADLATPLSYLAHFVSIAESGADIVAGTREGASANRIGEPWHRHVMGRVFNRIVQLLLIPGIEDTQCGFKLFTRPVAVDLLASSRLYRDGKEITGARVTAFDVEFFAIARSRGYRIVMEPVSWTYGEQSKVNPSRDSFHNLRDVIQVFLNVRRGEYRRNGERSPRGSRPNEAKGQKLPTKEG